MSTKDAFARWFRQATGHEPYPFQIRFACEPTLPELVDVPTGMGKTAVTYANVPWSGRCWLERSCVNQRRRCL
jgi:CRISPR-associated endonuclease/helicase Cas3